MAAPSQEESLPQVITQNWLNIDRVQTTIDAKLEAQAAAGRPARESTAATLHRQPTPGSIAAAEVNLGDISPEKVQAVEEVMARAREARPRWRPKRLRAGTGRSAAGFLPVVAA
jgi:hypothetical protein